MATMATSMSMSMDSFESQRRLGDGDETSINHYGRLIKFGEKLDAAG